MGGTNPGRPKPGRPEIQGGPKPGRGGGGGPYAVVLALPLVDGRAAERKALQHFHARILELLLQLCRLLLALFQNLLNVVGNKAVARSFPTARVVCVRVCE